MFEGDRLDRLDFHGSTPPAVALLGLLSLSIVPFSSVEEPQPPPSVSPNALKETLEPATDERPWSLDEILDALRRVETGGVRDPSLAAGDDGQAIGPYQIHRAYWQDARLPGAFEDCRDAAYARRVVIEYWRRYCPEALRSLDAEILVRVHNGGPKGHVKRSTVSFWEKVQRARVESRSHRAPGDRAHET